MYSNGQWEGSGGDLLKDVIERDAHHIKGLGEDC